MTPLVGKLPSAAMALSSSSSDNTPLLALIVKNVICGAADGHYIGGWNKPPRSRRYTVPAQAIDVVLLHATHMGTRRLFSSFQARSQYHSPHGGSLINLQSINLQSTLCSLLLPFARLLNLGICEVNRNYCSSVMRIQPELPAALFLRHCRIGRSSTKQTRAERSTRRGMGMEYSMGVDFCLISALEYKGQRGPGGEGLSRWGNPNPNPTPDRPVALGSRSRRRLGPQS